ncbi:MAG: tetratricopeptide repeat protein [Chloroflexota bacterium]
MSSYEFWDELGKIFNAVVAYQEKNIEFNKRFISPWIRLGNVFEKQDRNTEAIGAYERAIEIDGGNPQNWFDLGNVHFKMENHREAISAFNRAIELDPGFGWAYCNLALTLVAIGETEQAVSLYQKGIELLQEAKDKAVAWNRLGNAYRKLNQYEQALEAFHRADELDRENAGFHDSLDEVADGPTLVQAGPDGGAETGKTVSVSPIGLIVAESRAAEAVADPPADEDAVPETEAEVTTEEQRAAEVLAVADEPVAAEEPVAEETAPESAAASEAAVAVQAAVGADADVAATEAPTPEPAEVHEAAKTIKGTGAVEETVTVVVQDRTETFTQTLPVGQTVTETTDATLTADAKEEDQAEAVERTADVITSEDVEAADVTRASSAPAEHETEVSAAELEETQPMAAIRLQLAAEEELDPAPDSLADQLLEAEPAVLDIPQHVAYEEYLKDTSEPIHGLDAEDSDEVDMAGSPEPVAKIDASGDLQIEMDTKNAHVWNELGNVYFNTSAYDDAIVAYSKAIELDRWFAWPYSNLALAYVQKRRFVEAILLYQRSIELFSSDKDKAISWNRLGNVYRRLNDYENAIAAYQRADALDPDNSTLSLQSRFSLLGNYAMEQKPSYVS